MVSRLRTRAPYSIVLLLPAVLLLGAIHTTSMKEDVGPINPLDYGSALNDTTLTAALNAIGKSTRALLIPTGMWTIVNDLTIPENVATYVMPGAIITVDAGKTLTIAGPLHAPHAQIFSASSNIAFSGSYLTELYPEWWGAKADNASDSTAAINAALRAAAFGPTPGTRGTIVRFSTGTYLTSGALLQLPRTTIQGAGMNSTRIINRTTTTNVVEWASTKATGGYFSPVIRDIALQGGRSVLYIDSARGALQDFRLENIRNSTQAEVSTIEWVDGVVVRGDVLNSRFAAGKVAFLDLASTGVGTNTWSNVNFRGIRVDMKGGANTTGMFIRDSESAIIRGLNTFMDVLIEGNSGTQPLIQIGPWHNWVFNGLHFADPVTPGVDRIVLPAGVTARHINWLNMNLSCGKSACMNIQGTARSWIFQISLFNTDAPNAFLFGGEGSLTATFIESEFPQKDVMTNSKWESINTFGVHSPFNQASLARIRHTATTFATLGSPANGSYRYCADCVPNYGCTTQAECTCRGGGSGAHAKRQNAVWICN